MIFPAPILILAPHPDDETAGVGGLIARAAAGGAPVFIVFLTDGAPRRNRFFARDFRGGRRQYRAARRKEAVAATGILGVPAGHLFFCPLPDLELGGQMPRAAGYLHRAIESVGPRTLLAPAAENGHPDHDATQRLAIWAWRRWEGQFQAWEYPLYAWRHERIRYGWLPPGPGVMALPLGEAEKAAKSAALAAYASQHETLAQFPVQCECLRPLRRRAPRRHAVWRRWGLEFTAGTGGHPATPAGPFLAP